MLLPFLRFSFGFTAETAAAEKSPVRSSKGEKKRNTQKRKRNTTQRLIIKRNAIIRKPKIKNNKKMKMETNLSPFFQVKVYFGS